MAAVTFCVVAPETERLDRFLADQLALSRTVAARIIADKRVTRDGRPLRASVQLERGAVVTVELPPEAPPPKSYAPAHRDLTFAYEDEHLAVLDKPAGLRSEEHTSELQSQSNLVCRLLLEKKKTQKHDHTITRS